VLLEIFNISIASYEPQEFIDDGLKVQFLGGEKREAFAEIKAHLVAKHTLCAGSSAV
jgi:hypothetical protein